MGLVLSFLSQKPEEVPYELVDHKGPVQIRNYCVRVVIESLMRSESPAEESKAFRTLLNYISGTNADQKRYDMTIPVEIRPNERCRNPSEDGKNEPLLASGWIMRFTLPSKVTLDEAPLPVTENINLDQAGPQTFAVLAFSGPSDLSHFEHKEDELVKLVRAAGSEYEILGPVLHWTFNPPWTPSCFRRNEVAVEVKKRQKTFKVKSDTLA